MTINLGGKHFTKPVLLSSWQAPSLAGLYVILTFDGNIRPLPYRPIYFGETDNLGTRRIGRSHDRFSCWSLQAGGEADLYISIFIVPLSNAEQRRAIEQQLIAVYRTPCND
jgi:hypothetical protein